MFHEGHRVFVDKYLLNVLGAALGDTGALAAEFAQIVQLGATDAAKALHFDLGDAGAMERENALDADAVADLADGVAFADAAVLAGDDDALKSLKTFTETRTVSPARKAGISPSAFMYFCSTSLTLGSILLTSLLMQMCDYREPKKRSSVAATRAV